MISVCWTELYICVPVLHCILHVVEAFDGLIVTLLF